MAFVNASLIALGGALILVPIALHLLMRQQPKRIVFPALRFVKQREARNRTRLRLRQWLLLALRCALVLMFAALLARPTVDSAQLGNWLIAAGVALVAIFVAGLLVMARTQGKGRGWILPLAALESLLIIAAVTLVVQNLSRPGQALLGDQRAPVAVAYVVDVAPRMMYLEQSQTRLDRARESALSLLRQLPEGCDVAVLDTGSLDATFLADRGAAVRALRGLEIAHVVRSLPEVMREAYALLEESDKQRKELYVFTDLSRQSWTRGSSSNAVFESAPADTVGLYILDVRAQKSRNLALGVPRIANETLTVGGEFYLETEVVNRGPAQTTTVELLLEPPSAALPVIVDGRPDLTPATPRRRVEIYVPANGTSSIDFSLGGLEAGVYHGSVQLRASDGLAFDDRRYFTITVEEPWTILILAGSNARSSFLRYALEPIEDSENSFRIDERRVPDSSLPDLARYDAVCLLNPPPLTEAAWKQLAEFVQRGHGLIVCLGDNARKSEFNSPASALVLPGLLGNQWRAPDGDVFIAPTVFDHPALRPFAGDPGSVPWDASPVWNHWGVQELLSDATVICRYSNGQPALVERLLGNGRVVLLTTSISDPPNDPSRPAWNRLLTGALESWPGFVLCNELVRYAAGGSDEPLNFLVGQTAALAATGARDGARWQLFTPTNAWRDLRVQGGYLSFPFTEDPGNYRIGPVALGQPIRGFSANIPMAASDLERLPTDELEELLTPWEFQLARNQDDIQREVRTGRVGREFYPYIAVLLAILLVLEYVLANCFHAPPLSRGSLVGHQAAGVG